MDSIGSGYQWEELFGRLREFDASRTAQRESGINDYNLLESVLPVNDEVRLHTRFLYSLLNPTSNHYQGTKFLDLFLRCLGRQGWLDLDSTCVKKEFCPAGGEHQIDLYLTDGINHILIENKLNAHDQPRQVERYIEAAGGTGGHTLFVYLTKGRHQPSSLAMGNLRLHRDGSKLVLRNSHGEAKAIYQNLSYRRSDTKVSIHDWLLLCEDAVRDIDNLSYAIREYRSVVDKATSEYRSQVVSLKEFLEKEGATGNHTLQLAQALARDLPKAYADWLHAAMTEGFSDLFESSVNLGACRLIHAEDSVALAPFVTPQYLAAEKDLIYTRRHNYFRNGSFKSPEKNRGAFALVTRGEYAGTLIFMFYGSKRLHVGCAFAKEQKSKVELLPGAESRLTTPKQLSANIFPHCATWSEPIESSGIANLADFEQSPERAILANLKSLLLAETESHAELI